MIGTILRKFGVGGVFGVVLVGAACRRGEPPSVPDVDAAVAPMPPPGGGGSAAVAPPADAAPSTTAAGHAPSATVATTPDAGEDPGALPQTKDKPLTTTAAFDARSKALWEAIVSDDPDKALPFFFPVKAYEQVKAIDNPASDWRRRLVGAYKRDIHALHKRLGEHASEAKLVRLDLPEDRAKWVEPGDEYNKLGYYRVYGTRIVYDVGGKERSFEISSLISWRGEWYVVHLTGFK